MLCLRSLFAIDLRVLPCTCNNLPILSLHLFIVSCRPFHRCCYSTMRESKESALSYLYINGMNALSCICMCIVQALWRIIALLYRGKFGHFELTNGNESNIWNTGVVVEYGYMFYFTFFLLCLSC